MATGHLLLRQRIPSSGSSLLNPRSQRARLRKAMATHAQQQSHFEAQAAFANIGGTGDEAGGDSKRKKRGMRLAASRSQHKTQHVMFTGRSVADRAKYMTDSEWESVCTADKHAFTKYMSQLLKEKPTEATEQQRRRYFETTMVDQRDLNPNRTVRDEYERIKLGLPVQLKNPQRSLGVSQAMYEAGDASLFDPENAHRLENAMTHIKQVFADYTRKKREGVATEAERRQLANLTAELNVETQKHLANMFKYAETRIRQISIEERQGQLQALARLREMATAPPGATSPPLKRKASLEKKKKRLTTSISKAIGLDVSVVSSLLSEVEAQERFMQFCEVFARLTVGRGFEHTASDERLDAYTESLKRLYSVDAGRLSTLDAVQYMAAKENAHPVEWARRWYERAILFPLQQTPEYQRLEEIRKADQAALELQKSTAHAPPSPPPSSSQTEAADAPTATNTSSSTSSANTGGSLVVSTAAIEATQEKVVRIVEKMFLRPDDSRLESLHEKRLRYLAYLQMERQISLARDNAKRFAGVEDSAAAAECRELYRQLLARKAALQSTEGEEEKDSPENVFADPEAAALFERIRDITNCVIAEHTSAAGLARTKASARAAQVARLLRQVMGGRQQAEGLEHTLADHRRALSERLIGIMERDVRGEMEWLENLEEAERPPLLPVPDAGMSYVSAADVAAWQDSRVEDEKRMASPFTQHRRLFQPAFLGRSWTIPDKPMLFWGTGTKAVQQALQHAAEDADRRRRGEPLAPPYPCAENPWGWRLVKDPLDD